MRTASLRLAQWHRHVNGVNAPGALRDWLTAGGSLTARLKAHSPAFRVQCLHQRSAMCLPDEAALIGLGRPMRVRERTVLLNCNENAVVFAHTVVPLTATASDWPLFGALGERSLGSTLFGDPQVRRGTLEFARLRPAHPLVQQARAALLAQGKALHEDQILYARRCVYARKRGLLLVTEVFLPALASLGRRDGDSRHSADSVSNTLTGTLATWR
ncbi:MAG: chorismate--pyruvate lyase [Janthinobacterium sp.]